MKQIYFAFISLLLCSSADTFSQSTDSIQASESAIIFPPKKFNNPFYNLERTVSPKPFTLLSAHESCFSLLFDRTTSIKHYYNITTHNSSVRDVLKFVGQTAISVVAGNNNMRYTHP